jgi:aquaporin PIP
MAENMKLGELVSSEETRIEKKSYSALLLDISELKTGELFRACLAEFIATAFFLYFTVGVACTNTSIGGDPTAGVGIYGVAAAFGASIFVLVYATAGFSGGHINPAVTWAMLISGR